MRFYFRVFLLLLYSFIYCNAYLLFCLSILVCLFAYLTNFIFFMTQQFKQSYEMSTKKAFQLGLFQVKCCIFRCVFLNVYHMFINFVVVSFVSLCWFDVVVDG
jgi:hypothetical protein